MMHRRLLLSLIASTLLAACSRSHHPTPPAPGDAAPSSDGAGDAGGDDTTTQNSERPPTQQQLFEGGPDLVNPLRGQYRWSGGYPEKIDADTAKNYRPLLYPDDYGLNERWVPEEPSASVTYFRFQWSDLQHNAANHDEVDFAPIDQKIDESVARGERFGFRVMMANLPRTMPAWVARQPNTGAWQLPDWNSADYLAAVEQLIATLGARYDDDDRVAFMDSMGYGLWGEWHVDYNGVVGTPISDANALALLEAEERAFPHTPLLQLTPHRAALAAILGKPHFGIRVDCLGSHFGGWGFKYLVDAGGGTKWREAPIVTEWCQSEIDAALQSTNSLFLMTGDHGPRQVLEQHVSLLSGANFLVGEPANSPRRNNPFVPGANGVDGREGFTFANKVSGYRYHVLVARGPTQVAAGGTATLDLEWRNYGVAPTYEKWDLQLLLRNTATGEVRKTDLNGVIDLKAMTVTTDPLLHDPKYPPVYVQPTQIRAALPAGSPGQTVEVLLALLRRPQRQSPSHRMPDAYYAESMRFLGGQPAPTDGAIPPHARKLWSFSIR